MKLTYRDKMLLTIILLVAVWALGIIFVIKPKIQQVSSKEAELVTVENQYKEVEKQLEEAKNVKKECNKALETAQKSAEGFFDIPTAYQAEIYLAKVLAGDANGEGKVEINALSISGPTAATLKVYVPTVGGTLEVPVLDAADVISDDSEETAQAVLDALSTTSESVGCYSYTVNFNAEHTDLMKFLTNIKATENGNSIIVTALNINEIGETEDGKLSYEGTMSLSLYFVKRLEGDDVDELIENQTKAAEADTDASDKE